VDTTQTTTHISLCAGYGGIDLGLKRAIPNLRTVAFSEIEAFACANLVSKMEAGLLDPAPIWTNLKTFPWESFRGKVDILSGGYPCQPFSSAGKRLGKDDPRHLWPYIADGIRILQPALCFFENVEGHITLGLRDVLHDLGRLGYRTTWGIFSASEVGAPHQRKRVFILAHRSGAGLPRHWGLEHVGLSEGRQAEEGCVAEGGKLRSAGVLWPTRPGQPQFGWEPPRVVATLANSTSVRCGERQHTGKLVESSEAKQEYEQGVSANSFVCCDSDAIVGLANATGERGGGQSGDALHQGRTTSEAGQSGAGVGDAQHAGSQGQWHNATPEHRADSGLQFGAANGNDFDARQTESALGRNSDGPAGGMDYAQLCVSGDNRIDELRLLGNGVVPATATRAFLTLIKEL
jgi:DNA (cytosine-5)-methyltransferase 1